MQFLAQQCDYVILKILSYLEGDPNLYVKLALTCKRMHRLCTSDFAWRRFNVFGVQNVYQHFVAEKKRLPPDERRLHYLPLEKWKEWNFLRQNIAATPVNQLNPYTQLIIILAPVIFCELSNHITDRRVMELGAKEPGNLIYYACHKLKCDPGLVQISLKSRQHIGILKPPEEWSTDFKINWHFAYANIDSEFEPPYSPDLHRCNLLKGKGDREYWSPTVLMDLDNMDRQTRLHIKFLTSATSGIIKMRGKYYELNEVEDRLKTDKELGEAALDSGVETACFCSTSMDLKIRALARGGLLDARQTTIDKNTAAKYNSWVVHKACTKRIDRLYSERRDSGPFKWTKKQFRQKGLRAPLISFRTFVAAVRRNACLSGNLCPKMVNEHYLRQDEFKKAEQEAKMNRRYVRRETRKYCEIEWYLQLPVARPLVYIHSSKRLHTEEFWTSWYPENERGHNYPQICPVSMEKRAETAYYLQ